MLEVEVKVRASHDDVRPKLDAIGADPLGSVRQVDTYYAAPHRDFADTDEALRIRSERADDEPESATLTYKGPLIEAESKTRSEAETGVDDPEALADILGELGFEPAATVRKDRERFAVDGYRVTLDTVHGLGEFVEVEAARAVESDALERVRDGALDVLTALELDPTAQIRTSYLGLLLERASNDT